MSKESILDDLEITQLGAGDARSINEALQLMNRTQGQGLFGVSYLTQKIESDEAIVLVGMVEATLVAVGCAEIITSFNHYAPFGSEVPQSLEGHKVGSLCALSVLERYQGQGIGQVMTKHRMAWMEDHNCDIAIGISWVSSLDNTSDRVFERTGFNAVGQAADFYKEMSQKKPFECPGCRRQPCACSAVLYWRSLRYQSDDPRRLD